MGANATDMQAMWFAVALVLGTILGLSIRRRDEAGEHVPVGTDTTAEASPDPEFDPDDPNNWHGIDYVHDAVIGQLDRQEERWKEVDGRLRLVLGVVGILFAAGGGFMRSSQPPAAGDPSVTLMPAWIGTAVIGGVALYLVAALVAIWGYRPQSFDRPPKPVEMRADYLTVDPAEAKREVIDTVLLAYDKNERTIEIKFRAFWAAFLLATIATGAIGVALIGQIALQTRPWL